MTIEEFRYQVECWLMEEVLASEDQIAAVQDNAQLPVGLYGMREYPYRWTEENVRVIARQLLGPQATSRSVTFLGRRIARWQKYVRTEEDAQRFRDAAREFVRRV